MNELVSIIVPVYNADDSFCYLLRSLFGQTYSNIEYVFVNDGSTNNCVDRIRSVFSEYFRPQNCLKIISHDNNQGTSVARRTGIQEANGQYIMIADQDDVIDLDMVQRMFELVTSYDSDVAYCSFDRDTSHTGYGGEPQEVLLISPHRAMASVLLGGLNEILLWNKIFRTNLFRNYDLYAPIGLTMDEDLNVMYRLFYYAQKVVRCSNNYYHWRNNPSSASKLYKKKFQGREAYYIDALKRMDAFFIDNKIEDPMLIRGLHNQRKKIMITLALYGDLRIIKDIHDDFSYVKTSDLVFDKEYKWYALLVGVLYKFKLYYILQLFRLIERKRNDY